jgi:hypothetical protein
MEGAAAQIKAAVRTISPRVQREKHCCKDLQSIAVPWQSHSGNRSLPDVRRHHVPIKLRVFINDVCRRLVTKFLVQPDFLKLMK